VSILHPILLPLLAALLVFFIPKKVRLAKESIVIAATLINLVIALKLFGQNINYVQPWVGFGFDFSLRLYHFSGFILAAIAGFSFLVALFTLSFLKGKENDKEFYVYLLITLAFANGAVLAENLVLLLFFWEGLLATLFGFILSGGKNSFKAAIKAFTISGITDLCMMLGIILTIFIAGTSSISHINLTLTSPLNALAFTLLMIGAISKAGSMPFHSWIPDAAVAAPLPFMAFLPAALEKLLGIYFLARISLNMFQLTEFSWVSYMLMIIGTLTIILAVMMALIQKDYKRLLSYHAISQVGYMILGIGTALPIGIVGGLFHMINHAMYKSCLFLTGGSVEKQAGTTDIEKLGGLGKLMPITFVCFLVAAFSISGVPPFNGFFSKEMVYDAALERGWIFYAIAALGSFFTAASFLKLGHAVYFGKINNENNDKVKEAPIPMLIPMVTIALLCVIFGIWNQLPINYLIQPILGNKLAGHSFAGFPTNMMIVFGTLVVIVLAILNHLYGVMKGGSGAKASDHIHYAPGLAQIYDKAEKRFFDPYDIGLGFVKLLSRCAYLVDRFVDWIYEGLVTRLTMGFSRTISKIHRGNFATYLVWSLVGLVVVVYIMMAGI